MSRPTSYDMSEMNKRLQAELQIALHGQCDSDKSSTDSNHVDAATSSTIIDNVGLSSMAATDGSSDVSDDEAMPSLDSLAQSVNAMKLDIYGQPVQPHTPSGLEYPVSQVSSTSGLKTTFVRKGVQESSNDPFKSSPVKVQTTSGRSGSNKSNPSIPPTTSKLAGTNDSTPSNSTRARVVNGLSETNDSTPSNNRRAGVSTRQPRNETPTSQRLNSRTSQNWRVGNTTSNTASSGSGQSVTNGSGGTEVQPGWTLFSQGPHAMQVRGAKSTEHLKSAEISNSNAQAVYPPSSCVFVANLAQGESEEELQHAVAEVFSAFGPVFVKIRRDPKNMPFAFCQYTCDGDADDAIREGKGSIIHGRPCRVERVKAHRTFMLSSRYGSAVTLEYAQDLLREFGEIERAWMPTETEIEMYDLSRGVFVSFVLYEAGRDALNAFKDNDEYKLEFVKPMIPPAGFSRTAWLQRPHPFVDKYEIDRRSIFVGNLPQDFTERQVYDLFCRYGPIIDIQLHRRQSIRDGYQWNVFAFVEFHDHVGVERSIMSKHNTLVDGCYIRVSTKNSDHNRQDRRPRVALDYDVRPTHRRTPGRVVEYAPVTPQYAAPYGISPPYYPNQTYSGGYPGYSHAQYYLPPPQWNGPTSRPVGFENSPAASVPGSFYPGYPYSPSPAEYHAQMAQMYYHQYYPMHQYGFSPPYSEPQTADSVAAQDGGNNSTLASNVDSFAPVDAEGATQ